MADRKDVEAGKAHVSLYLKDSAFMKGLQSVGKHVTSWGKGIAAIGAGITGLGASILAPITAAIAEFSSTGDTLDKVSARTGVAVGSLAELKFAAEQSGASLKLVEKALLKMGKEGIDPNDFDKVAARIAAMKDPAQRIAAAMEVWGDSGAQLIPMLSQLQQLRQEARDAGLNVSPEDVAAALKLGDVWAKLFSVVKAGAFSIGAALAPVLTETLETVVQIAVATAKWVNENRETVQLIAIVGAGLAAVGTVVTAIGIGLIGIGAAIAGLSALIAFIATPVGAIVVTVAALGTAIAVATAGWLLFTQQGRATARAIYVAFKPLVDFLSSSFKGVLNAALAGNFELAWKIVAKTFKIAMMAAINDVFQFFLDRMAEVVEQLPGAFGNDLLVELRALQDAGAEGVRLEGELLKTLLRRAQAERGSSGSGSGSLSDPEKLKSFGSFNTVALTMQNWGKGGIGGAGGAGVKRKTTEEWLEQIAQQLLPRLIQATKDNQAVYGD